MNKKSIRSIGALNQQGLAHQDDLPILEKVAANFSIAISHQMHELIDKSNPNDPIAKQFVPNIQELEIAGNERLDPIGDEVCTTVPGIIHRYPDRCLFTPVHVCPVYCRFCFRREKIGSTASTLSAIELDNAFAYLNDNKKIWEVILTGGDPLILKPKKLKSLLDRLNAINHIDVLRIHTRIPIVESHRINSEMIAALKGKKTLYIALHANHPNEFTTEAIRACADLVDAGIPLLSQTVLLKGINDNIEVLTALMRCFVKNRIKPYYLHHGDLARGTQHFRTSIATGQRLMKELRGRTSGMCQPTYVLDIPGGHGKIPIGPHYLKDISEGEGHEANYILEDYCGNHHHYPPK